MSMQFYSPYASVDMSRARNVSIPGHMARDVFFPGGYYWYDTRSLLVCTFLRSKGDFRWIVAAVLVCMKI